MISIETIRQARARIRDHVHQTPVATCSTFDAELGAALFFKCENLQKVGAFKARGAVNAVLSLSDGDARRGVLTHSSGNHAAALAYAASIRGIPCTVVMPERAPAVKVAAVRGYGATVHFCREGERESTAAALCEETGATFVHPFDDPRIIAGQATAALELHEQVADLDLVVVPCGGGGLLSGTALATRALRPGAGVLGVEPEAADDARRSLETGVRQPGVPHPATIADGLLTGLSELTFGILREHEVEITAVPDTALVEAARDVLQRMKLVVEPSAATVLAALRAEPERWRDRRVGLILSGGNTDLAWLPR